MESGNLTAHFLLPATSPVLKVGIFIWDTLYNLFYSYSMHGQFAFVVTVNHITGEMLF